ncbi:MAG: FHA domain-containing protein [Pseudomonadota bacterium]
MAKLVLTLDGATISEHELDTESVSIGRKPDNDIVVDNLAVSGHHCQIITILNDSFLEDLNSTNGTYVNGALAKKHALQDGDMIGIGKHQIRFENPQQAGGENDFEKTMIIRPDEVGMPSDESKSDQVNASVAAMAREVASSSSSAPKNSQQAKLQIINGANAGKELPLSKALTTVGKPGTQVAAITRRPKGFFILHVEGGSENKTPLINNETIGKSAHPLKDGDVIEVAGIQLKFIVE